MLAIILFLIHSVWSLAPLADHAGIITENDIYLVGGYSANGTLLYAQNASALSVPLTDLASSQDITRPDYQGVISTSCTLGDSGLVPWIANGTSANTTIYCLGGLVRNATDQYLNGLFAIQPDKNNLFTGAFVKGYRGTSFHSSVLLNGNIYTFGGYWNQTENGEGNCSFCSRKSNAMVKVSLSSLQATDLSAVGPSSRGLYCMQAMSNTTLVIHGGQSKAASNDPTVYYDDVWQFDTSKNTWNQLNTTGPSPRLSGHACVTFQNTLFVFGGQTNASDVSNAIYALDLTTFAWTVVFQNQSSLDTFVPAPRRRMSVNRAGKHMVVYGGYLLSTDTHLDLNQFYSFDLCSKKWVQEARLDTQDNQCTTPNESVNNASSVAGLSRNTIIIIVVVAGVVFILMIVIFVLWKRRQGSSSDSISKSTSFTSSSFQSLSPTHKQADIVKLGSPVTTSEIVRMETTSEHRNTAASLITAYGNLPFEDPPNTTIRDSLSRPPSFSAPFVSEPQRMTMNTEFQQEQLGSKNERNVTQSLYSNFSEIRRMDEAPPIPALPSIYTKPPNPPPRVSIPPIE